MMWLDFKIFGNGRGLKSPRSNDVFYWLIDEYTGKGNFYTFYGWLGAQIQGFQWFKPIPKDRINLLVTVLKPYQVSRAGPRVRVSWRICALDKVTKKLDADHDIINDFRKKLRDI